VSRWLAPAAALILLLAPSSARGQGGYDVPVARPNIVFVLTDDLSMDLVRRMPAVRELRHDGVRFSRYIVSNSLCCPSRASILTGKLPHNTGVVANYPPLGGYRRFLEMGNQGSTFASSLRSAGYRTALLGKFLNGYLAMSDPPLGGFDEWAATAGGYRQHDYVLNENGFPTYYGDDRASFLNAVLTRKAAAFIDTAAAYGLPFMLNVSTTTPHQPFAAARRDRHRFRNLRVPRGGAFNRPNRGAPPWLANRVALDRDQRARMDRVYRKRARAVQAVDRMVATLRERLAANGIADRTYVVFSSDNGFHAGEHQLLPGKKTAFDHDVRVPLIVAGPGIPAGRTTGVLAQNTDLRPTFEAMAGRPVSGDVDGVSLLPWLREPALGGGRDAALVEHELVQRPGRYTDPDAQPRAAGQPPDYTALRLPDATYVEYDDGGFEYYDLLRDPEQRVNRYAELSPLARTLLSHRAAQLRRCAGAVECAGPAPVGGA